MPKVGFNEAIAVVVGLLAIGGFFLFLNPSTSLDSDGEGASAISSIQDLTNSQNVTELVINDLVVGTGRTAREGDTLLVHYAGILTDGTQFDSSVARGEPFQFMLGRGEVISGWDQGLVGMREGGRRILVIPPSLAYGAGGTGTIPGDAVLIFEVVLLGVFDGQ